MTRASLPIAIVLLVTASAAAQEQEAAPPRAAVLTPATTDGGDGGLASAFERVLRARLDALDVVEVEGTPALNLADLQLAVGCVADTPTCHRAVAEQLGVTRLMIPSIDRAGETLVGTITYFDAASMQSKSAVRRAEGERAPNELLAQIDAMVRELFELPPPEEPLEPVEYELDGSGGGAAAGPQPPALPPEEPGPSPIPFIVAGVGLAALGTGVAFGLMSESTEGDWENAPTGSRDEVDDAIALREDAEQQATIANILLGVGGGLVVIGAALFVVLEMDGGDEEPPPSTALRPWVAPDGAGIAVAGHWGDAL